MLFSTFGLSASDYIEKDSKNDRRSDGASINRQIPPFRDSFQTSSFLAVRQALRKDQKGSIRVLSENPEAILHEVGKGGIQLLDRWITEATPDMEGSIREESTWITRQADSKLGGSLSPRSRLSSFESAVLVSTALVFWVVFCFRPVWHLLEEVKQSAIRCSRKPGWTGSRPDFSERESRLSSNTNHLRAVAFIIRRNWTLWQRLRRWKSRHLIPGSGLCLFGSRVFRAGLARRLLAHLVAIVLLSSICSWLLFLVIKGGQGLPAG